MIPIRPASRPATLATLLFFMFAGGGCQAINDLLPPDPDRDVNSVTIQPTTLSLFVGEQSQLTATAYSLSGLVVTGKKTTWTTDTPAVATVGSTGLVTGVGEGFASIRASIDGVSETIFVQVSLPPQRLTISATAGMPANIRATAPTIPVTSYLCNSQAGQTASCTFTIPARTAITLYAFPNSGGTHSFVGWSGEGCAGTARCEVVMDRPRTVSAGYAPRTAATLNLAIDGAMLTQAVQRFDQSVELVAGKDAFVRVWALANQSNTAQPRVRIRLFHGSTEVQSTLVNAGSSTVALQPNEAAPLTGTWNVAVPGALVIPGLRFSAEVDPEGLIAEHTETDNRFPLSGTPRDVTVRNLPPLQVRMIPIRQSATGLLGEIDASNVETFLTDVKKRLPVGAYQTDIRATYTTSAPMLMSNDGNGAWATVLNEILALRNTTDQSNRYYYGVVKLNYTIGQTGIAMIPNGPSGLNKVAVGMDIPLLRSQTMAHELGHNFGRKHAPCGATQGLDEFYPERGGATNSLGLDLAALEVKTPNSFDLMSYCHPQWISDYTWSWAMQWRLQSPTGAPPALSAGGPDDGLLVWGRIAGGRVILEPAFRTTPVGSAPNPQGTWLAEGRDAAGALLFRHAFEPDAVADLGSADKQFAFVLPVGAAAADRLASLRVSGPEGSAEQRTRSGPVEPGSEPVARPLRPGVRRLTWDAAQHPMAMIRDADTGEILSFARGGAADLWSDRGRFDVQLSDGVRIARRRVEVR